MSSDTTAHAAHPASFSSTTSDVGDFALDAKYRLERGRVFLTGLQALVRVPIDQHRADRARGLNTGTLISGYRGSPLAGYDSLLMQNRALLDEHGVVFIPGVNEDLAATAVYGSQVAKAYGKSTRDGVCGIWYGKAPGVDRSGDALKHANFGGVDPNGGVLAIAGDDPLSKSSTLPSHSEVALYDALIPTLYPGSVQEVLDHARAAFELSRYSGLWTGMKLVTDIADGFGVADVSPERLTFERPPFELDGKPWKPSQQLALAPPFSLVLEREVHEGRLPAARAFASANRLTRTTVDPSDAWIGIVAAGKTYYDVRQALDDLGLDDAALARARVRLLKVGLLFPFDVEAARRFARGLEEVLVVEEKRAFIEMFVRDALYGTTNAPRVVGKRDEMDRALIPAHGELDADSIVPVLLARLARRIPLESLRPRAERLREVAARSAASVALPVMRQSFFCSGCPHNRSTVVPEGSIAGGGIGCHGMALMMNGRATGISQMGGEGTQWVGASPFSEGAHLFQNLGDGTLFHSGSLAIRQAVAAETNITYKILHNSAVGMTGGQHADGAMPVPALTRALEAEGVKRIIVTTDDPDGYPNGARWAPNSEVWHRDRLDEAQRALRDTAGVTVLIHDQPCAAELRRQRKRGRAPERALRVVINERVCEGCGDCGVKSNCLSVQPVETEFGRKTQINQSSCNTDYSCLLGDCPSFVTVEVPVGASARATKDVVAAGGPPHREVTADSAKPADRNAARATDSMRALDDVALPDPRPSTNGDASLFFAGIGGTGVVTVNQIVGTAAMLDGKVVLGLDQTGLSQKAGPVSSHLKILAAHDARAEHAANKVGAGDATGLIIFDVLSGSGAKTLSRAHAEQTVAVVSTSRVPTGAMVASPDVAFPELDPMLATIARATRARDNVYLDADALAVALFGDSMPANMIAVGAAFQIGLIPVAAASMERAIALNGVAVKANTRAFRAGRRAVHEPSWAEGAIREARRPGAVVATPAAAARPLDPRARTIVDSVGAGDGELRRLLEIRVPDLIAYQNEAYAASYAAFVARVLAGERAATPSSTRLSESVARQLHRLMAYKDEYEVARLHVLPEFRSALADAVPTGTRRRYQLHPPLLRALGWTKKISFGEWFDVVFRALAAMRMLRGTPLDPFGYATVRRTERSLIGEYRAMIEAELATLSPESHARAVTIAELPAHVRGYEEIKLRGVAKMRAELAKLR